MTISPREFRKPTSGNVTTTHETYETLIENEEITAQQADLIQARRDVGARDNRGHREARKSSIKAPQQFPTDNTGHLQSSIARIPL